MKTVAMIYGWAEGPWQARSFKKALQKEGLVFTNDILRADVIVAHSSGCYLIPKNTSAKLIVLVGLPYWPGRSLASSVAKKLVGELRYHRRNKDIFWWLNKIMHNIWYIITRPHKSLYAFTRHRLERLPSDKHRTLLVRPTDDTFCHPNIIKTLKPLKNYGFEEISGEHDDCWVKPKPYVDLILKEL